MQERSKSSLLAALTSGFVGALALATSVYTAYLQRTQVRAEVWPHLTWSYADVNHAFTYNVENDGVGPAIIRGVRVSVDKQPVKRWNDAFEIVRKGDPAMEALIARDPMSMHSGLAFRVVAAGATIHPLEIDDLSHDESAAIGRLIQRVAVTICYCSTLDECWTTSGFTSEPVPKCPEEAFVFED